MAISGRLKDFLESAKVRYTVAKHPVVYTAQEIAAAQHVPGRQLAKSVLVLTEHGPVLAVLPAIHRVHLPQLKQFLKAKKLSIAREADVKQHFPDIEVGAMSPFGNLYGVPVAVDKTLSDEKEIVFNAGSHTETVKLGSAEFVRLVKPKVGVFGQSFERPAKKPKRGAARKRAARKRPTRRKASPKRRAGSRGTARRSPRR